MLPPPHPSILAWKKRDYNCKRLILQLTKIISLKDQKTRLPPWKAAFHRGAKPPSALSLTPMCTSQASGVSLPCFPTSRGKHVRSERHISPTSYTAGAWLISQEDAILRGICLAAVQGTPANLTAVLRSKVIPASG